MATLGGGVPVLLFVFGFYCILGIAALLSTIFWIWMLIDCLKYEQANSNDKIIWILVIVFTHLVGAIIYFFMRRQPRLRQPRPQNVP